MTHPEYYEEMGIKPPKGVILYGPPGTGIFFLYFYISMWQCIYYRIIYWSVYINKDNQSPLAYVSSYWMKAIMNILLLFLNLVFMIWWSSNMLEEELKRNVFTSSLFTPIRKKSDSVFRICDAETNWYWYFSNSDMSQWQKWKKFPWGKEYSSQDPVEHPEVTGREHCSRIFF